MAPRKKSTDETKPATPAKKRTTPAAKKKAAENGEPAAVTKTPRKRTPKAAPTPEPVAEVATPAPKGGRNLVIVESPAKAKTIQKYLGSGYEVRASFGHIRDLPKKPPRGQIGIDIEAGWVPTYVNLDDDTHKRVLAELKKLAAKSPTVFLASDRDREGESIAWHLQQALGLPDERVRRVTFNEITKKAITDAFAHAGSIDMDRVLAQEARRFLDRVVGYKLSPLLRKKIKAESAGRVQSVAVKLIVEREREIQAFKPEEYWKIVAELAVEGVVPKRGAVTPKVRKKPLDEKKPETPADEKTDEKPTEVETLTAHENTFIAELVGWNGAKFQPTNEGEATAVLGGLASAVYGVAKVTQKDRQDRPSPPFTTSTLQQQANLRLRFSTHRTMAAAQALYQGVDLGSDGQVALITYMRTDSTRISDDALAAVRDHIQTQYGDRYLPSAPNRYAAGKGAQEAHEAIRPTDLSYTPDRVRRQLAPSTPHREDLIKLYELIYRRFVACQMTPAILAITTVDVEAICSSETAAKPDVGTFRATGSVLKFDGYRKVMPRGGKQEDAELPALTEKQKLDLLDLLASQHFTQPPPRYNEASLVKTLEEKGIGRPSTYASIIKKIQDRNYVRQEHRRFFATELGMLTTDKLDKHFPDVVNYEFTSRMEKELDQIEERNLKLQEVMNDFYGPFSKALEAAKTEMEETAGVPTGEDCPECSKPLVIKYSRKRQGHQFVGCSGYPECKYIKPEEGRVAPVETDYPCPTCGKPMLERMGQRGKFLGCSGYPECKTTMNFDAEGKPVLAARPTEHVCDKCSKPMVLREGKRGPFLACTGYPKCKNAKDVDEHGNPRAEISTGVNCEKCGSPMRIQRGFRGAFLGCSAYPKCRSTKPLPEELKEKVKEMFPPAKKEPPQEVDEACPECGNTPMTVRRGRGGLFLGCKKYPTCKGTKKMTPEIQEKIQAAAEAGASS